MTLDSILSDTEEQLQFMNNRFMFYVSLVEFPEANPSDVAKNRKVWWEGLSDG